LPVHCLYRNHHGKLLAGRQQQRRLPGPGSFILAQIARKHDGKLARPAVTPGRA
jgi:hypothetical protein